MEVSRRRFLQLSAAAAAGSCLAGEAPAVFPLRKRGTAVRSICQYCAVGCGVIATVRSGRLINVEGDPEHPINRGALCSKGLALLQVVNNERRLGRVLYRAPGSAEWETKSWDWALPRIARRIKETRDKHWTPRHDGKVVNRAEALASLGGAALNNEECYALVKALRALGMTFIEHQARICHSSTVAALAESFGRGAMTNHWIDIRNADAILVIGSNAAENHPCGFRWAMEAMDRGAKLISVDPRFTRTSALAHVYVPMRSGGDIAFIGGLIHYVLENGLYHREYVANYTDAAFLVDPQFGFEDGMFTLYDAERRSYDRETWRYQTDSNGVPKREPSLQDPRCVFQLLREFYSRYTLDAVADTIGAPRERLEEAYAIYGATGTRGKAGTIMYAMGTTQHTSGTQNIRSYAMLQLLLGNIGLAGGGVNALRGLVNVQGSTDHCLLFHILPGYLSAPLEADQSLDDYLRRVTPTSQDPKSLNWWKNYPKYMVSLLKAWYGAAASADNDFAFNHLPKRGGNCSHISLFEAMYEGQVKGLLVFGQNPAVSGPNANMERRALANLDWMAATDLWETETASFWKAPGQDPSQIKTEVFLLPAASALEKSGSVTNSGRWAQWRHQAVEPVGDAKSDLWIVDRLVLNLKRLYAEEGGPNAEAIQSLTWDYGSPPDPEAVAREINGYATADIRDGSGRLLFRTGSQMPSFAKLSDDGSTACGNWLYCGSYPEQGNLMDRRVGSDPSGIGLYPEWSWCWPVNRRIIYNRASVDSQGNPWDPEHPVIQWNAGRGAWDGDVPDGGSPPGAIHPFIMKPEGHGRLFGYALRDGPFPEHYEPWESPVDNALSRAQSNPVFKIWASEMDAQGDPENYPVVATTFRLTEHMQAGAMTRNLPWLVELQPEMFVELGPTLAAARGIRPGKWCIIESARGSVRAKAIITPRLRPLRVRGRDVHQIALPWHFGFVGLATGDSANVLTPHVGDANTMIPEYKAFLCQVRKA